MSERIEALLIQNQAMLVSIIDYLLAEDDDERAIDELQRSLVNARPWRREEFT